MGVDTSLLASSLNAVVAQRLARRLCMHCRQQYTARPEELGLTGPGAPEEQVIL
jgi:type II secretory ATPase GspE/PulE/Tfp pilus assembly ATPase PilB-like protein